MEADTLKELEIAFIRTDGGTQPRAETSPNVVGEYAADMMTGVQFPPITVFFDGSAYWLADGFHRYAAALSLGQAEIACDVKQGTRRDAVLFSVGANTSHGLRRTNADKRRAVETLLSDEEWRKWSNREIARRCGVNESMVRDTRETHCGNTAVSERAYTDKHGNTTVMNTSNIGKREAVPFDDYAFESEPLTPYEELVADNYESRMVNSWSETPTVADIAETNTTVVFSAASVDWYTPNRYIEAARNVMGGFDTDPASNETAQRWIGATTHYTIETNGFDKLWQGRVWLNPPYGVENGKAVAGKWGERLIQQYDAGITTEAVLLVNAVIDSKWFNILWRFPICFTDHRIRFELPEGSPKDANISPVIGSAIVYLGSNVAAFVREFSRFGAVVTRLREYEGHVYSEMETHEQIA